MTPPTEKPFEPTPEQVDEAKARFKTVAQPLFSHEGIMHCLARYHVIELHRETETLRSQVEALKAQVVVKDEALGYIANHPTDNEALCVFEMQHTAKQALTQLEAK